MPFMFETLLVMHAMLMLCNGQVKKKAYLKKLVKYFYY